ncbi:MAG: type I methionyl aminopeptidase [Anaeromyxobacter sp.]|nr:type I methionyl aminopeptidase [Anaeromyxobacter sp.]MBL0277674.1 type I methionyl aminopeptidase [Anaeromyxobacter sp.]
MDALSRERIAVKSRDELARIRDACRVVHDVLAELAAAALPGVTTAELDRLAEARARQRGAEPAFLGYHGYPASVCISLNDEVVHGIPSALRVLRDGDIVGLDFGVVLDGFYGDSAVTVPVGTASPEALRLIEVTRGALARAVAEAWPDRRVGDIGAAVQAYVEPRGFSVVRDFVGHGIGRRLHEPPQVPNFGSPGTGPRLRPGMVLALEPMVNAGGFQVETLDDGWTAVTQDGRLSAHFEHTVAITEDGPEILTVA